VSSKAGDRLPLVAAVPPNRTVWLGAGAEEHPLEEEEEVDDDEVEEVDDDEVEEVEDDDVDVDVDEAEEVDDDDDDDPPVEDEEVVVEVPGGGSTTTFPPHPARVAATISTYFMRGACHGARSSTRAAPRPAATEPASPKAPFSGRVYGP
jgi:hypothetical protein